MGERVYKGSAGVEDKSAAEASGKSRSGKAERVGKIEEVPQPPGERSSEEEGGRGEDGASNELRTVMAGIDIGGEEMNEYEWAEFKKDVAEAKEGAFWPPCRHWNLQGS